MRNSCEPCFPLPVILSGTERSSPVNVTLYLTIAVFPAIAKNRVDFDKLFRGKLVLIPSVPRLAVVCQSFWGWWYFQLCHFCQIAILDSWQNGNLNTCLFCQMVQCFDCYAVSVCFQVKVKKSPCVAWHVSTAGTVFAIFSTLSMLKSIPYKGNNRCKSLYTLYAIKHTHMCASMRFSVK